MVYLRLMLQLTIIDYINQNIRILHHLVVHHYIRVFIHLHMLQELSKNMDKIHIFGQLISLQHGQQHLIVFLTIFQQYGRGNMYGFMAPVYMKPTLLHRMYLASNRLQVRQQHQRQSM